MNPEFFEKLASLDFPNTFNPWADRCELDAVAHPAEEKLLRLRQHLAAPAPRLLLLGEAAGYQGCRYSGVTFTSERLLLEGAIARIDPPAQRLSLRPRPWSEPSATIVWGALHEAGLADHTLMWNAFPLHPHKPGNPFSNRAPNAEELRAGAEILQLLLEDLPDDIHIAAVGRKAEQTLAKLGVGVQSALRHPAMGGAPQFRAGLKELAREF